MPAMIDDSYMQLIRRFPLVPIRTDEQLDDALEVIEPLAVKGTDPDALTAGEAGYLEVLCRLVEDYEQKRYPMPGDSADSAA